MRVLRKSTPSELFRMYKSKNVIAFEHWMEPFFFWDTKTKWIHDDGSIVLMNTPVRGGHTYCYTFQIYEDTIFWKYKNSMVKFFYNLEDMSKVYLFERFTWKFIGEIKPTLVLTKANKEEILKIHQQAVRNVNTYRVMKRKQNKNIANGLPDDFGITTPNLEAKILRGMLKGMKRKKKKEKGEVDISNIKVQHD